VFRLRRFLIVLAAFTSLCVIVWQSAQMQTPLRRITNTTEEGISLNPTISGDGRMVLLSRPQTSRTPAAPTAFARSAPG
jgi:hypothetical protein